MAASPSCEWEDAPCVKSCPRAHLLSGLQTRGSAPTLLWTICNKNAFLKVGNKRVCARLVLQAPRSMERLTTELILTKSTTNRKNTYDNTH